MLFSSPSSFKEDGNTLLSSSIFLFLSGSCLLAMSMYYMGRILPCFSFSIVPDKKKPRDLRTLVTRMVVVLGFFGPQPGAGLGESFHFDGRHTACRRVNDEMKCFLCLS
jgi:hypothetical protein